MPKTVLWRGHSPRKEKIMYLYLVLNCGLKDTIAAVKLLKELYQVENRGLFGNLGLVFACEDRLDPDHMETLNIIDFV